METIGSLRHKNNQLQRELERFKMIFGKIPYIEDYIIKGGYKIVYSEKDRDAIDCCYRKLGMRVIVIGKDFSYKEYVLKGKEECNNDNWELIVYGDNITDSKVFLVDNYDELDINIKTQRDLNLKLVQLLNTIQGSIPTKTSELINDGEDGENPYITLQDIPEVDISGKANTDASNIEDNIEDWYNALGLVFNDDITVTLPADYTFGKYENGDVVPAKGKSANEVIQEALRVTLYPTLQAPSASLSIDTTTREVGSNYSLSATVNFNRGSIKGKLVNGIWEQNTEQNKRAGEATKYIINGVDKGLVNSNTVSGVVALGTNSFSGSVTYAQGPQPTDSSGSNYSSPLAAGTLNVSSSFTGMYKIFWGADESDITDYRSLPNNKLNNSGTSVSLASGTTYKDFYLVVPSNRSLSKVIDTGALNADITNSFVQSSINVNDAGGNPVAYKLYKMSNADTYDVSHIFTITIV